jgi:hypothetical protein
LIGEQFAPADQVSDEIASGIANAVHGLKAKSGWSMRFEDWYHDLPVWLGVERSPATRPYRVLQASVLLVRNEEFIEVTCERRENINGSVILKPVIDEPFVQRMPIRELGRVGEVVNTLWARTAEFPRRRESWNTISIDRPSPPEELGAYIRTWHVPEPVYAYQLPAMNQVPERAPRIPPTPAQLIVDYRSANGDEDAVALEKEAILSFFRDGLPTTAGAIQELGIPDQWTGTGGKAGGAVITLVVLMEGALRKRVDRTLKEIVKQGSWNTIKGGLLRILQSREPRLAGAYLQLAMRFGPEQWVLFRFDHGQEEAIERIGAIGVAIEATTRFLLEFEWISGRWRLTAG